MGAIVTLLNDPAPVRRILRLAVGRLRIGSYRFRVSIGAVARPHYAYIVFQAAPLAARLGQDRISVIELGVAGGNGLLCMERHAAAVEKIFPVAIDVYGFDSGSGLPEPADHRDLPYHWKTGFFRMDRQALDKRLARSTLIIGDVRETAAAFLAQSPAPIGAVSHDFDFYSSTMSGLKLFEGAPERLMPRVFCYFDDTVGGDVELYTQHIGERAAIDDWNASRTDRKLGTPFYLKGLQALGGWVNQIWVLHVFDHPRYAAFVSAEDQQLPLN